MSEEAHVYQRIGEFAVSFQWLENRLREIGWFIMDPGRTNWPPTGLRNLTNEKLIDRVHDLFVEALPKCRLSHEEEVELEEDFAAAVKALHQLRRNRNRILHSAFVEMKAGGEVRFLLRSSPKIQADEETGEHLFDQEVLTPRSFAKEMEMIAFAGVILNRAYVQLIHRYSERSANSSSDGS